jgi:hypothetical protein
MRWSSAKSQRNPLRLNAASVPTTGLECNGKGGALEHLGFYPTEAAAYRAYRE